MTDAALTSTGAARSKADAAAALAGCNEGEPYAGRVPLAALPVLDVDAAKLEAER